MERRYHQLDIAVAGGAHATRMTERFVDPSQRPSAAVRERASRA
jgi:hypothetical protein